MSHYSLAQKQFRSNIDHLPSQRNHCSMSRPISDTGATSGRPPPTSNPSPVNKDLSSSSGNNGHVLDDYSMLTPPPPSLHQWSYQKSAPAVNRFPSSSRQSQSYNDNPLSVNLPPLNQISDSRKQYSEPISSNDSIPEESGEDGPGLPLVLKKYKLDGPQSSKSNCDPYSINHSLNAMSIRPQVDSRSQSSVDDSLITHYPPDRRKTGRSTRCNRAQILEQPYFAEMIKKVLDGADLKDITPTQVKALVRKYPVSSELIRKWEEHAEYKPDPKNPKGDYSCTFCGYTAKKQLMSRHILGCHLRIKFYGCPFCDGSYHQIMSAVCHITTHLGVYPYKCPYCDQRFNDVARRHRHCQEKHDYKAKKTKRTPKSKSSQEEEPSDST